ncbi:HET-domain-containing protein [Didymella exigua CBS 183.55]|uniref:HET-domain-containing protein n=1 Tax=Didymella exigua CBS 183.55 TaxID=1150837 RepID=A0A6A5RWJ9_9PLEO|nr:HET-domain-containing protein [Didymella exigua CBS 183.55]KAF1931939.1 HET-domain-containing protein [Didymella exigua CBS 183.55]
MRVLRTDDLSFEEFPGLPDKDYAILSHVWGKHEISYQDVKVLTQANSPGVAGKYAARAKLTGCRAQARKDGLKYLWIDTCCIDKHSHSEFSEAINSMFHWYKSSKICYVYLTDVSAKDDLEKSKWFTRGWTLQELLAPTSVVFFNKRWDHLGDKIKLHQELSAITQIPPDFLLGRGLEDASIAQRMSWASNRTTSKEEDLAYCLLGIFDVHMPLLYGEQLTAAFRRLQIEILQMQDDTSIFAWQTPLQTDANLSGANTYGLLAPGPASFKQSTNVIRAALPVVSGYKQGIRTPILFNNKGLHLSLPVLQRSDRRLIAILGCTTEDQSSKWLAVWLQDISQNDGRYVRINNIQHVTDREVRSGAYFQDITTETRLFRTLSVIPRSRWHSSTSQN